MTILIAYLPTPQDAAALDAGFAQARLTSEHVVIVNSPRRGSLVDTGVTTRQGGSTGWGSVRGGPVWGRGRRGRG